VATVAAVVVCDFFSCEEEAENLPDYFATSSTGRGELEKNFAAASRCSSLNSRFCYVESLSLLGDPVHSRSFFAIFLS
jgi:hypothetical protein